MMTIKERLTQIREKIEKAAQKAGRAPEEIKLLGASKTQPPEKIREAFEAGLSLFGENYVQEAKKKKEALKDLPITWHLIGYLQRNKAKDAVKIFHMIETIDRKVIASELAKRVQKLGKTLPVLIEVNVGGEETKAGVLPEDLPFLIEHVLSLKELKLSGLMTIPPYREDPEEVRPFFARLRELRDEMQEKFPEADLKELSMGMSHDFHIAIEEGATIVRVGTALFGPRPKKA